MSDPNPNSLIPPLNSLKLNEQPMSIEKSRGKENIPPITKSPSSIISNSQKQPSSLHLADKTPQKQISSTVTLQPSPDTAIRSMQGTLATKKKLREQEHAMKLEVEMSIQKIKEDEKKLEKDEEKLKKLKEKLKKLKKKPQESKEEELKETIEAMKNKITQKQLVISQKNSIIMQKAENIAKKNTILLHEAENIAQKKSTINRKVEQKEETIREQEMEMKNIQKKIETLDEEICDLENEIEKMRAHLQGNNSFNFQFLNTFFWK